MIEIKNRYTGEVIVSGEYESIKDCLQRNRYAKLTGAYLTDADIRDAKLTNADLIDAKLTGADLTDADLTGANLTNADLRVAKLTGAFLTGADLTGAKLTNADLTNAKLTGANLTDADLRGAKSTDSNGNEFEIKTVLQLLGFCYNVYFFSTHMKIGCECHPYTDWWNFDDKRILEMDGKCALNFWDKNKDLLRYMSRNLKEKVK